MPFSFQATLAPFDPSMAGNMAAVNGTAWNDTVGHVAAGSGVTDLDASHFAFWTATPELPFPSRSETLARWQV